MPDHIRFILRHAAFGVVIALAFVGMLLVLNVANLRHLVTHTDEGPIALAMLVVFCTITFGAAQIGYKIMTLGADDDDRAGKGDALGDPLSDGQPVPVPARHRERRS